MFRFLFRLITLPFRVGYKTGATGAKITYRSARFVGVKRMFVFGIGVGVGLLVAPMTGRELRAKLQEALGGAPAGDGDLGERVRFELSHSPRTWHLPQPSVAVEGRTIVLEGEVPHATAKADLEEAANTVPGVGLVESHLQISGTNGQG